MCDNETFLTAARRDLLAPASTVDIDGLAGLWRWDEARVTCERPQELEDTPDLALRVRGALGRVLRDRALAPRRSDPWSRPSAFELFYQWAPPAEGGFEVARPFVIRVDVVGGRVEVAARLFGWAGFHIQEVREALWTALEGGVSLRAGARWRVPFRPIDASLDRREGVSIAGPTSQATLILETPTVIRAGRELTVRPAALPMAAARRAASLAPWMGVSLDQDVGALRAACLRIDYRTGDLTPARWVRHSIRRPGEPIPVYAFEGRVAMSGRLEALAPYLRLAETCGLGSHAALGFGRNRVAFY